MIRINVAGRANLSSFLRHFLVSAEIHSAFLRSSAHFPSRFAEDVVGSDWMVALLHSRMYTLHVIKWHLTGRWKLPRVPVSGSAVRRQEPQESLTLSTLQWFVSRSRWAAWLWRPVTKFQSRHFSNDSTPRHALANFLWRCTRTKFGEEKDQNLNDLCRRISLVKL